MFTIAHPTPPDNRPRYFATYFGDITGVATVLDAGTILFALDGAHGVEGQMTLAARDPELVLAGHVATATAQRQADQGTSFAARVCGYAAMRRCPMTEPCLCGADDCPRCFPGRQWVAETPVVLALVPMETVCVMCGARVHEVVWSDPSDDDPTCAACWRAWLA